MKLGIKASDQTRLSACSSSATKRAPESICLACHSKNGKFHIVHTWLEKSPVCSVWNFLVLEHKLLPPMLGIQVLLTTPSRKKAALEFASEIILHFENNEGKFPKLWGHIPYKENWQDPLARTKVSWDEEELRLPYTGLTSDSRPGSFQLCHSGGWNIYSRIFYRSTNNKVFSTTATSIIGSLIGFATVLDPDQMVEVCSLPDWAKFAILGHMGADGRSHEVLLVVQSPEETIHMWRIVSSRSNPTVKGPRTLFEAPQVKASQ